MGPLKAALVNTAMAPVKLSIYWRSRASLSGGETVERRHALLVNRSALIPAGECRLTANGRLSCSVGPFGRSTAIRPFHGHLGAYTSGARGSTAWIGSSRLQSSATARREGARGGTLSSATSLSCRLVRQRLSRPRPGIQRRLQHARHYCCLVHVQARATLDNRLHRKPSRHVMPLGVVEGSFFKTKISYSRSDAHYAVLTSPPRPVSGSRTCLAKIPGHIHQSWVYPGPSTFIPSGDGVPSWRYPGEVARCYGGTIRSAPSSSPPSTAWTAARHRVGLAAGDGTGGQILQRQRLAEPAGEQRGRPGAGDPRVAAEPGGGVGGPPSPTAATWRSPASTWRLVIT